MKSYIHARLTAKDRLILDALKKATGHSESELVRLGLHLVLRETGKHKNALELAGSSAGKFEGGPRDLARNKKHMDRFGR